MLMTVDEFRTKAGLTRTTTEGTKIKAVQTKLAAYHNAVGDTAKARALAELNTAVSTWQAGHAQTSNTFNKKRSRGKRRAMDELYWQVEATLIDETRSLVMTLDEFRTMAGLTRWTAEGTKIKDVQNKLRAYHAARGDEAKSTALTNLKTSCETWRDEHVSPVQLGGRSSGKMAAMDQLSWQLAIMNTPDMPEPMRDPNNIARKLLDNKLVVHETTPGTQAKLRKLMGLMRNYYDEVKKRPERMTARFPDPSEEQAIRVGTIDISTFDLLQRDDTHFPERSDGVGDSRLEPPTMDYDATTQRVLVEYLKSLLVNELKTQSEVALAGAALGGKHRAQISVDYYFARSTSQISLHKDTMGNTLFVMLHYLNRADMTGPEYIWDRWPVAARTPYLLNDGTELGQFYYSSLAGRPTFRPRAPWTPNRKWVPSTNSYDSEFDRQRTSATASHFWPGELIEALERARAVLPETTEVMMSELGPYGLISFVDELVYHSTPLKRRREEADATTDKSFSTMVTGMPFYISDRDERPRRERAMSRAFERGDFEPKTGFKDKRSFLRLWISVTPKLWYNPFDQWKRR